MRPKIRPLREVVLESHLNTFFLILLWTNICLLDGFQFESFKHLLSNRQSDIVTLLKVNFNKEEANYEHVLVQCITVYYEHIFHCELELHITKH